MTALGRGAAAGRLAGFVAKEVERVGAVGEGVTGPSIMSN
jgi:hypothetical protein